MHIPSHCQAVIVGGGIAGCSTASHLASLGRSDVLVLEHCVLLKEDQLEASVADAGAYLKQFALD